jgi:outer membrane lipoprotein SlyB
LSNYRRKHRPCKVHSLAGKFSLSGLAGSIDSGAVAGALGGFLGGAGGKVIGMAGRAVAGGLLSDGAATAATRKPPPPAA